jgi:hypothetical protein
MKTIATLQMDGQRYAVVPMKEYQRLLSAHGTPGKFPATATEEDGLP